MKIDEIIETCLANELKRAGYECMDKKALIIFKEAFDKRIMSILHTLRKFTSHSLKDKSTMIEAFVMMNDIGIKVNKRDFVKILPLHIEKEEEDVKIEFHNKLASVIDKYIHVYEFMPDFPPAHSFKKTFIKGSINSNFSEGHKKRLEQSAVAEANLYKMLHKSNKIPQFANYLKKL